MAKSNAVWGIDIGQCALKALRCTLSADGDSLVAQAFDHIEYPKILSQPDADIVELIREALDLFLSRNEIQGDTIVVSVPGQSGLVRFIKLPPVESKKLAAIVSYEAKQQIPFPLDEVIWDYQKMPGGSEEEGFTLETEVGLFAMKRDQVFRAIRPFENASVELDVIQLSPLALFNFVIFDQLRDVPPPENYDPENPPESLAIISIGTDSTDLVVTNGYRVWQRNVPLGGNHFTKQLSKELKLTFAKAEQLKRNAQEAHDPKQVFQAMRPVFKDFVTELQRSIGFFQSLEREARIGRVLALGNAIKLPGLIQYLEKSLGYPVVTFKKAQKLEGATVTSAPSFKENIFSIPVCYGLAVQGLEKSTLKTNLLPREILTRRTIKEKKPWAVFVVAVLLLGCLCNYVFHWNAWSKVREDLFRDVVSRTQGISSKSKQFETTDRQQTQEFEKLRTIGEAIVSDEEGRLLYPELLLAIHAALPGDSVLQGEVTLQPLSGRPTLYVQTIESKFYVELSKWWNDEYKKTYQESLTPDSESSSDVEEESAEGNAGQAKQKTEAKDPGPKGTGWVIELRGYHYHNEDPTNQGWEYVRGTLVRNLQTGTVTLPDGPEGNLIPVGMKELGIQYPLLLPTENIHDHEIKNPRFDRLAHQQALNEKETHQDSLPPDLEPELITVPRYNFVVQFCWQEKRLSERTEQRIAKEEAEAQARNAQAGSERR
ncbi:MAG: pilus assembly protein PilM [Planctomycetaceae bacterium]|nr:pilus assembly protein PilM [Planctomycetaceae bacterium]MBP61321.1 pilus assembly protein PilM [Planctomycetaceae bacterium]